MRRTLFIFSLASLLGLTAYAQSIELVPQKNVITTLPGGPIEMGFTITNPGPGTLTIATNDLAEALTPSLQLLDHNGVPINCWTISTASVPASTPTGAIRLPQHSMAAKASFNVQAKAGGMLMCPLSSIPPGRYDCTAQLTLQTIQNGTLKTLSKQITLTVQVLEPRNKDQAYLQALYAALAHYQATTKNPIWDGQPLKWREVLNSPRLHSPQIILSHFPTSTYAGYALAQSGPGGSLAWSAKWGTLTARQRDDAWYVPQRASPDQQEARRQLVLGNYTAFAQEAQTFLSLHPNFARADLLRKELANALFQLDQRDAAMQQVEALSKMKGPCAEEAQALLQTEKPASR